VRKDFTDEELPKINLSNVRLYGSLAYCRIQKQIQSDKMAPRAEIGFLVGFVASNIWRIWFPHTGKVQVVRDAVFDESRKYVPGFQQYQQIPMPIAGEPQVLTRTNTVGIPPPMKFQVDSIPTSSSTTCRS